MYNQYLPTLSSSNTHSIQKPLSNMYLFKQFGIILTLFMVTTIQANPMQQMAFQKNPQVSPSVENGTKARL